MEAVSTIRRIVLHLDVNKTLIMSDPAAQAPISHILNSMIAASVFGTVSPLHDGTPEWKLASNTLHVAPPCTSWVSYESYIRNVLNPYKMPGTETSTEDLSTIRAYNAAQREKNKVLIRHFTDAGAPGECFQCLHDELTSALHIPEAYRSEAQATGLEAYVEGSMFMLPAYFHLLRWLASLGIPFLIIMRTFGNDGVNCAREHNLWVQGKHPFIPTGPANMKPLMIRFPDDTAAFSRTGTSSKDVRLASIAYTGHSHYPTPETALPVVSNLIGYRDIFDFFMSRLPAATSHTTFNTTDSAALGRCMIVRDDFEWWFLHGEQGAYGKVLPIDPSDSTTLQMFLDDNIGSSFDTERILPAAIREYFKTKGIDFAEEILSAHDEECDASIVDVRDIHTACGIGYQFTRKRMLCRVDPISAILNENYFVELVKSRMP